MERHACPGGTGSAGSRVRVRRPVRRSSAMTWRGVVESCHWATISSSGPNQSRPQAPRTRTCPRVVQPAHLPVAEVDDVQRLDRVPRLAQQQLVAVGGPVAAAPRRRRCRAGGGPRGPRSSGPTGTGGGRPCGRWCRRPADHRPSVRRARPRWSTPGRPRARRRAPRSRRRSPSSANRGRPGPVVGPDEGEPAVRGQSRRVGRGPCRDMEAEWRPRRSHVGRDQPRLVAAVGRRGEQELGRPAPRTGVEGGIAGQVRASGPPAARPRTARGPSGPARRHSGRRGRTMCRPSPLMCAETVPAGRSVSWRSSRRADVPRVQLRGPVRFDMATARRRSDRQRPEDLARAESLLPALIHRMSSPLPRRGGARRSG